MTYITLFVIHFGFIWVYVHSIVIRLYHTRWQFIMNVVTWTAIKRKKKKHRKQQQWTAQKQYQANVNARGGCATAMSELRRKRGGGGGQ